MLHVRYCTPIHTYIHAYNYMCIYCTVRIYGVLHVLCIYNCITVYYTIYSLYHIVYYILYIVEGRGDTVCTEGSASMYMYMYMVYLHIYYSAYLYTGIKYMGTCTVCTC